MKVFWLGVACMAVTACVPLSPVPDGATGLTQPAAVERSKEEAEVLALLAYYQGLLSLPAEELRREYQDVSRSFGRDRSELGRLKLALLMSVPEASWRDDARLLVLLEGSGSRTAEADSPRRQFVFLLQKWAGERQREQRRADELQQKLDALLTIERNLQKRKLK